MIIDFEEIGSMLRNRSIFHSSESTNTVVHCHGVFDILHIGHLKMLEKAAALGDKLVVSVTADEHVGKGPGRPVYSHTQRAEMLHGLECVDHVVIVPFPGGEEIIRKLNADVYVKGGQYKCEETPALIREKEVCLESHIKFEFIHDPVVSSSTELVKHVGEWPKEVVEAIEGIKKEHGYEGVVFWLDKACEQSVVVMGEAIIDEYVQCEVMGRSSKSHLAALRKVDYIRYPGGSVAVAVVLKGFCNDVSLVALTGNDEGRDWLKSRLTGIKHSFIERSDAPTITKRRYWESYYGLPMCEVYEMSKRHLHGGDEKALLEIITKSVENHDVTIVIDYGHGMFTPNVIKIITGYARYLSLNVQQNAGNQGLSKFQKWKDGADCCTMALAEFWLSRGERIDSEHSIRENIRQMSHDMNSNRLAVTRGKDGCLALGVTGLLSFPSMAFEVKDRVGAGDVFLAFFSLFSACSAPLDVSLFVSSAAAAFAVSRMGPGGEFITRDALLKHIKGLIS